MLAEGVVCDVLYIDVQSGPEIHSVLRFHDETVLVQNLFPAVGLFKPFVAALAVQCVVEGAFQSDMVVSVGPAVVFYVTYNTSCQ